MKKYRGILLAGIGAALVSALMAWLMANNPHQPPVRDLGVGFVLMTTMATIYGAVLTKKVEELRNFMDETFRTRDWRVAAMNRLAFLADRAEEASRRVIALQRGGLKEIGLDNEPENVEKDFETAYHNANSDFRRAQDDFYKYFDLVRPFGPEIGLELSTRNFKSYLSM